MAPVQPWEGAIQVVPCSKPTPQTATFSVSVRFLSGDTFLATPQRPETLTVYACAVKGFGRLQRGRNGGKLE